MWAELNAQPGPARSDSRTNTKLFILASSGFEEKVNLAQGEYSKRHFWKYWQTCRKPGFWCFKGISSFRNVDVILLQRDERGKDRYIFDEGGNASFCKCREDCCILEDSSWCLVQPKLTPVLGSPIPVGCHKRQKPQAPTPQAPIRNRQKRKVAKVLTAILTLPNLTKRNLTLLSLT